MTGYGTEPAGPTGEEGSWDPVQALRALSCEPVKYAFALTDTKHGEEDGGFQGGGSGEGQKDSAAGMPSVSVPFLFPRTCTPSEK